MIKEIALRKLASDEGVNPYGVGALGAAGLTGFGYSSLFNKVFTKDLDNKYNRASNAWNKTYESLEGYRKSLDKVDEKISNTLKAKLDALNRMYKAPAKNAPAFKSYIDILNSDLADLDNYRDVIKSRHVDRLSSRIKKIQSIRSRLLNKHVKLVTPAVAITKLVAPAAAIGLGGKYLYDKLKQN